MPSKALTETVTFKISAMLIEVTSSSLNALRSIILSLFRPITKVSLFIASGLESCMMRSLSSLLSAKSVIFCSCSLPRLASSFMFALYQQISQRGGMGERKID